MNGWLLDCLEIEGIRGINNENDPLVLKFEHDAVNSVSAPNAVGKSSIFDALAFALRGSIRKLDDLPSAEKGEDYYINRFHSKGTGTVSLTLSPEAGGVPVRITVTRAADGTRAVSGPAGVDAEGLLASLNRDFVLLDHKTLQNFIDEKALDRGRAFAGLLGLARYSALRQELQGLANTRAYNNHVDASALNARRNNATKLVARHQSAAQTAFQALTQGALADQPNLATAAARAYEALFQIGVLKPHCTGKSFDEIVIDDCLGANLVAEGGEDKARLATLLSEQPRWEGLTADGPTEADQLTLMTLAKGRDEALAATSGALLRELYALGRDVLANETWTDKTLSPPAAIRQITRSWTTCVRNLRFTRPLRPRRRRSQPSGRRRIGPALWRSRWQHRSARKHSNSLKPIRILPFTRLQGTK